MTFDEFKQTVLDVTPITDGLKFNLAIFWLHPERLPVGVTEMHCTDAVVRIPQWYQNRYGRIVHVIAVAKNVLGTNPNMTDLILPPTIDRLGANMLQDCSKLKRLTFPKKITTVPAKAFEDCVSLEDVYSEGSREDWEKIDIVTKKDEYIVDDSKLGLYCKVETIRHPIPGNEALFKARIHFDCDLGDGTAEELRLYVGGKELPLLRTV